MATTTTIKGLNTRQLKAQDIANDIFERYDYPVYLKQSELKELYKTALNMTKKQNWLMDIKNDGKFAEPETEVATFSLLDEDSQDVKYYNIKAFKSYNTYQYFTVVLSQHYAGIMTYQQLKKEVQKLA